MNIKEAKEQIKNAMMAYFTKDEFGSYVIPPERQRPIFLLGPPGIGKTAIMEQIASELSVGLVSYSMTHHTRQSALGLPFISHKIYDGKQYDITEYTMSEIIASIYDLMEETNIKQGILFLDEVNCISETLSPMMLQFLQYKVFGRHKIPNGWIVVTAGNPPEYNNSVREFDIATLDRLKKIEIDPNFDVWKEYAYKKGVHASIITYLEIKKGDFYKVESTVDGKGFVTARGWTDLSDMINLYEKKDIVVDETLISQYLQNKKIAKDFAVYYDLFKKYKSDYKISEILIGKTSEEIKERVKKAKFDERITLIGLILDKLFSKLKEVNLLETVLLEVLTILKNNRNKFIDCEAKYDSLLQNEIDNITESIKNKDRVSALSSDRKFVLNNVINVLDSMCIILNNCQLKNGKEALALVKNEYDTRLTEFKSLVSEITSNLSNIFMFFEEVFGKGQEMLILEAELTINIYSAHFISRFGCKEYFQNNKELLFYQRQRELSNELDNLEWE